MKRSIVVVGSSNTDMILQMDRIPRPGETILGGAFSMAAGGKGANQAVAAARAGGQVSLVAKVGRDVFGEQALAGFARDGIDTRWVMKEKGAPSGVALIFVANTGENSIAVAPGANAKLSPADVRRASKAIAAAHILLAQLETPLETVTAAVELAAANGVQAILNPAPARPLPRRLLKKISILTPNETEAEMLTGIAVKNDASAGRAADALHRKGVNTVIVTMGSRGAFVSTPSRQFLVPGFKVKAVDTTAAGDVFNGALAVALSKGQDLAVAVRFANAAAALSVTRLGAQPSAPSRREIDRFQQKRRRD